MLPELVRATRPADANTPQFIKDWVLWGVGPRGGQSLIMAARARAALDGRPEVGIEDIRAMASAVLRHRMVLNYTAESLGQTTETVVKRLVETLPLHEAARMSGLGWKRCFDKQGQTAVNQMRTSTFERSTSNSRLKEEKFTLSSWFRMLNVGRSKVERSPNDRSEKTMSPLDPKILARITPLGLRAQKVVEGSISGLHRSPLHGVSVEFADYREYSPGDDLKRIDWKAYARSNKFQIKRYEEESNLRATIVLDASASMRYGNGDGS